MPEQGPQKVVDPSSIGGNSENTHPDVVHTRKESRPAAAVSRIPVPKSHRVPFKRVNVQPASRSTGDNKPSKTSEQAPAKDVEDSSESCSEDRKLSKENQTQQSQSSKSTRVKKVPDFKKLHDKWHQKIEKAKKDKRTAIEVHEFDLTPAGRFTPTPHRHRAADNKGEDPAITTTPIGRCTTAMAKQISPFKVDAGSLHAILHGDGGEPPPAPQRATLAGGPRIIPGEFQLPHTSYRYSMYRRRKPGDEATGSPSVCPRNKGRELLMRLTKTTLNSIRTVTKVNSETSDSMTGIKMNLELKLTAEGESGWKPNSQNSHLLSGQRIEGVRPRIAQKPPLRPMLVPRDQFYVLEPELCELLGSGATRCIGGRGHGHGCSTPAPVAHLLENVYFIPINN